MTEPSQIVPALGLAGALLLTAGAANAQATSPAATTVPMNAQSTADVVPAAFHGGGGAWMHGGHGGGHHGHWGRGWGYGPLFGLGATVIAPDDYAYGGGCGFYRVRWNQTGLAVWRRRYYECVYG